jgi:hypothetical protein
MAKKTHSRKLRQLAENLLREMAGEEEIPQTQQDELVTSLVRQWLTYDGNAALFFGDQQIYFPLGVTPLGKPCVFPEPALSGWLHRLSKDWKICPEELPAVVEQLNRGQSAEVNNGDGVPLRFWVNPKERRRGIEPLVKQPTALGRQRDYHKIAGDMIEQAFGASVDAEEREQLNRSVARQWQKYRGHACLFVGNEQLVFTLIEMEDGNCRVKTGHVHTNVQALLGSLGFAAEVIPEVIARINLDQAIEFVDKKGVRSLLWHDPQARRIRVRPVGPA